MQITETPKKPSPKHHQLQCMEVWGGSNKAEHIASVPTLNLSVHSRPIGDQGGDLYLISSCSSGWITRVLLADVAGHGSGVSDLAGKLRKAMHRSINTVDQSQIAEELNTAFDAFSREGRFATALLMTYFAQTGHLIMVNAGHPPPLMQRAGSKSWFPLEPETEGVLTQPTRELRVGVRNLPLGVISGTEYEQVAIPISAGDRVCLYTDAYTESVLPDGRQLGVTGLCDLLQRVSGKAPEIESFDPELQREMRERDIEPADDDYTMVLLEHNGRNRPPMSIPVVANWLKSSFGLGHSDSVPE